MFYVINNLLAQQFALKSFDDPAESLPPRSVLYFMTAPLKAKNFGR